MERIKRMWESGGSSCFASRFRERMATSLSRVAMHHLQIPWRRRHSGEHVIKFRLVIVWCLVLCIYKTDLMSQIGIEIIRPSKPRIRNLHTPEVLLKSQNAGIESQYHQNKAPADKGWFLRTTQAWAPELSLQKQFSLVFVYFYLQFYSLPNNFWFQTSLTFSHRQRPKARYLFAIFKLSHRQYFV